MSNGQLSEEDLRPIAEGQLLKAAAAAWNAMNVVARREGLELLPNGSKSSYRTIAQQRELYAEYLRGGTLAAKPGTSNHGWGLAVDVKTKAMREMVDRIGAYFGWSKAWSDAPTEWWHIKYEPGIWSGSDPGPYGHDVPTPKPPEDTVALAVGQMKDGRFEVFVETKTGEVFHAYQSKEGGWATSQDKKTHWFSLGTPGK